MADSEVLIKHLNDLQKYHPHYGDRLASHLPMALIALDKLGASKIQLQRYYQKAVQGLELIIPCENPIKISGISEYLGCADKFVDYLEYFTSAIKQQGSESVLQQSLPVLLPGLSASAFHAVIRLAYAILAKSEHETAFALAFLSAEYQAFELNEALTNETPPQIITRLVDYGMACQFEPGIIVDRMVQIGRVLKDEQVLLQPQELSLSQVANFCLSAFTAKPDFTLLHTVTACHAFRVISPYIKDLNLAVRLLWQAIVVAYLSTGLDYQPADADSSKRAYDIDHILTSACVSSDAHVIKLVYSCLEEYRFYRHPGYHFLAARAVGLSGMA